MFKINFNFNFKIWFYLFLCFFFILQFYGWYHFFQKRFLTVELNHFVEHVIVHRFLKTFFFWIKPFKPSENILHYTNLIRNVLTSAILSVFLPQSGFALPTILHKKCIFFEYWYEFYYCFSISQNWFLKLKLHINFFYTLLFLIRVIL